MRTLVKRTLLARARNLVENEGEATVSELGHYRRFRCGSKHNENIHHHINHRRSIGLEDDYGQVWSRYLLLTNIQVDDRRRQRRVHPNCRHTRHPTRPCASPPRAPRDQYCHRPTAAAPRLMTDQTRTGISTDESDVLTL